MAAKKTAKQKAAKTDVKFVKGAFYEDQKKNHWYCTSPKQKKTPDGHMVVLMQRTEDGVQVGEPGEEYVDTFVRLLTKAEVKAYRDACRREKEALAEAGATVTPAAEPRKPRRTRKKAEGRMSCPDAAVKVLAEEGRPMSAIEMIEAMATKGYWSTPGGATPHATLYSAIIREIAKKGADSRFAKSDRGRFTATGVAAAVAPAESTTKKARKGGKKASV